MCGCHVWYRFGTNKPTAHQMMFAIFTVLWTPGNSQDLHHSLLGDTMRSLSAPSNQPWTNGESTFNQLLTNHKLTKNRSSNLNQPTPTTLPTLEKPVTLPTLNQPWRFLCFEVNAIRYTEKSDVCFFSKSPQKTYKERLPTCHRFPQWTCCWPSSAKSLRKALVDELVNEMALVTYWWWLSNG